MLTQRGCGLWVDPNVDGIAAGLRQEIKALKHGLAGVPSGAAIRISAVRDNGQLILAVQDNGVGMSAARLSDFNRGVGLSNTRARLEHLYGPLHRFEFRQPPEGGLQVLIAVPLEAVAEEVIGVRVVEGAA